MSRYLRCPTPPPAACTGGRSRSRRTGTHGRLPALVPIVVESEMPPHVLGGPLSLDEGVLLPGRRLVLAPRAAVVEHAPGCRDQVPRLVGRPLVQSNRHVFTLAAAARAALDPASQDRVPAFNPPGQARLAQPEKDDQRRTYQLGDRPWCASARGGTPIRRGQRVWMCGVIVENPHHLRIDDEAVGSCDPARHAQRHPRD
jgi:hypothetical protein